MPRDAAVEGAVPLVAAQTLQALTVGRILTLSAHHVELVHEALLDHWPRLRSWLDERSAVAELVEWLGTAARSWEYGGRADSDLARGPRLQAALDWQAGSTDDVAPLEHEFMTRSDMAAQGELVAARERADREARGRRRLRYVVAMLALVSVVAGLGVVVAMRARSAEQAAAVSADARRVAALSLTAPDLRTSLLLAAAAYRLQPSDDTRGALLSALQRGGTALWQIRMPGRAEFAGADSANRELWTMDPIRTVYRYDLSTRRIVASFPARADEIAALSPDGRQLVVVGRSYYFDNSGDGRISVLDARDGATVGVLPVRTATGGAAPEEAVFTADGRWLAVVQGDASGAASSTVAVFDASDYRLAPRLWHLNAPVRRLAAGREVLAAVTAIGTVEVVAASDFAATGWAPRPELAQPDPAAAAFWFAMSPDAQQIALTAPGDPAQLYLLDARRLTSSLRPLPRLGGSVASLKFSPTWAAARGVRDRRCGHGLSLLRRCRGATAAGGGAGPGDQSRVVGHR
jgi:hypothetical protein